MFVEINLHLSNERDALQLEPSFLFLPPTQRVVEGNRAVFFDNSVAGDSGIRVSPDGPADLASVSYACQSSDAAIGADFTFGDLSDHLPDSFEITLHGLTILAEKTPP